MDELLALEGYAPQVMKSVELTPKAVEIVKQVIRQYLGNDAKSREVVMTYAVCVAGIEGADVDAASVNQVITEMADDGEFAQGYGNSGVVEKEPVEVVLVDRPVKEKVVEKPIKEPGELIDVG